MRYFSLDKIALIQLRSTQASDVKIYCFPWIGRFQIRVRVSCWSSCYSVHEHESFCFWDQKVTEPRRESMVGRLVCRPSRTSLRVCRSWSPRSCSCYSLDQPCKLCQLNLTASLLGPASHRVLCSFLGCISLNSVSGVEIHNDYTNNTQIRPHAKIQTLQRKWRLPESSVSYHATLLSSGNHR